MKVKHLGYGLGVAYLLWSLWWVSLHGNEKIWSGSLFHAGIGFLAMLGTILSICFLLYGIITIINLIRDSNIWDKKLF